MDIEDFITQWTEGQCRKFAAEIEEYEQIMTVLTNSEEGNEREEGTDSNL